MTRKLLALPAALLAALAFASVATADVRPGVQTITDGSGQCTGNFIFSDGSSTYLGQSAHCASTGASTDTNGCIAESLPLGTRVEIEDASNPGSFPVVGTLAYSSWITMKERGEDVNSETCRYNDFALIKLPAGTAVNPTVPFWGGPNGIGGTSTQQRVFSYGNSSLRFGIEVLKPKRGLTVTSTPGGWSHTVYTATPGIPGDSGSAFLNANGQALGTLSTVAIAPFPASNGVSDLGKELAYMKANAAGFSGVNLQNGTVAFNGGKLL
jgi:hypothetical protein